MHGVIICYDPIRGHHSKYLCPKMHVMSQEPRHDDNTIKPYKDELWAEINDQNLPAESVLKFSDPDTGVIEPGINIKSRLLTH